jgi:hypothetical protein
MKLDTPITAAALDALVKAARENEMDLAQLMLQVEMPPVVAGQDLGHYATELAEVAAELNELEHLGTDAKVYQDAIQEHPSARGERLLVHLLDEAHSSYCRMIQDGVRALNLAAVPS